MNVIVYALDAREITVTYVMSFELMRYLMTFYKLGEASIQKELNRVGMKITNLDIRWQWNYWKNKLLRQLLTGQKIEVMYIIRRARYAGNQDM